MPLVTPAKRSRHPGRSSRPPLPWAAGFEHLESRTLFSAAGLAPSPTRTPAAAKHAVHAAPTAGGTGVSAEYFADPGLTTPALVRTDASISFKGAAGTSASLKTAGGARWTGSIAATATSTYTFTVQGTGGVKLWVNGVMLVDTAAIPGGAVRAIAPIALTAGTRYAFQMDYRKTPGSAPNVKLLWAANKAKQAVVPQSSLFPAATPPSLAATADGLIGKYYVGTTFQQLAFTRVDPTIDFNFGSKSPDSTIPNHTAFSILWTGQFHPTQTANYTFTTTSDDGVRVYVGTQLVIDNFVQQSTHTATGQIALTAGQAYDLKVEYFQNGVGVGDIKLAYNVPGQRPVAVAASMLSSTPPATAGVLRAVAAAAAEVDLSWTGSPTATGYDVSRSADGGVTWVADGTAAAGATTFADRTVGPDTAYAYRVVPFGSADTSTPSNVATVTTLTATPAAVSAAVDDPADADLSWGDVAGETGFDVLESVDGGPFAPAATTPAGVTNYHVSGLLPGTGYGFAVEALNAAGQPSAPTAPPAAVATPTAAPLALVAAGASTSSAVLAWTDTPGEGGFAVERSPDGGATWAVVGTTPAGATTFTDTGLAAGTTYGYRVRGLSAADPTVASDPSNVATAVTVTAAPAGVNATAYSDTLVNLTWADVTGEAGFTVLGSADGGATYLPVGTTAAGVTTFDARPLFPGTAYAFAVEAVNAAGQPSAPSAATTASATTTPTLAPAALTALGVSATSALLTWTPAVAATGYLVERSTDGVAWSAVATPAAGAVTYVDSTVSAGTTYSYRVRATDAGGASGPSPVAAALTLPGVVTAALAGLNVATSSVSFAAVTGATSYAVQRSTDGVTGWATVATVTPPPNTASPADSLATLSATVANVAPSTVYYYRVVAANATGPSAPSAVVGQMSAPLTQYALHTNLYGTSAGTGLVPASVYAVDMAGGTSSLIGQLMPGAYAATRRPTDGDVYYFVGATTTPAVYKWDPTTGNNSLVVDTNVYAAVPNRRAYDLAGNPWQTDMAGNLYSVNPAHATTLVAQMKVGGVALAAGAGNMAFSPSGTLYLANNGTIYTVNTTTAALTPALVLGVNDVNITFGANGLLYCTDSQGHEYSVSLTSLASTLLQNPAVPAFNSLTATPEFVDLGVTATATPTTFHGGSTAAYAVSVTNAGPTPADAGQTTVTVTLGLGLTFGSVAGSGWTAVASVVGSTTTVTLTYAPSLLANGNSATATLTVNVTSAAHASATSTFAVAGDQFDTNPLNNTAVATNVVA